MTVADKSNVSGAEGKDPSLFQDQPKSGGGFRWTLILIAILAIAGFWYVHSPELETAGQIKSERFVRVGVVVPGILKGLDVKKGDRVKAGDVIAKLENPDLTQQLKSKQIEIEKLNIEKNALIKNQEHAALEFSRFTLVYENKAASKSVVESKELALSQSKDDVEAKQREIDMARSHLDLLKAQIANMEIKAPFSGVILSAQVEMIGNYLKSGEELVQMAEPTTFYLEAGIPERLINRYKVGNKVQVRFEGYPTHIYSGEITGLSLSIHEEVEKVFKIKRMVACHVRLDAMPPEIRYGTQAVLTIKS